MLAAALSSASYLAYSCTGSSHFVPEDVNSPFLGRRNLASSGAATEERRHGDRNHKLNTPCDGILRDYREFPKESAFILGLCLTWHIPRIPKSRLKDLVWKLQQRRFAAPQGRRNSEILRFRSVLRSRCVRRHQITPPALKQTDYFIFPPAKREIFPNVYL